MILMTITASGIRSIKFNNDIINGSTYSAGHADGTLYATFTDGRTFARYMSGNNNVRYSSQATTASGINVQMDSYNVESVNFNGVDITDTSFSHTTSNGSLGITYTNGDTTSFSLYGNSSSNTYSHLSTTSGMYWTTILKTSATISNAEKWFTEPELSVSISHSYPYFSTYTHTLSESTYTGSLIKDKLLIIKYRNTSFSSNLNDILFKGIITTWASTYYTSVANHSTQVYTSDLYLLNPLVGCISVPANIKGTATAYSILSKRYIVHYENVPAGYTTMAKW